MKKTTVFFMLIASMQLLLAQTVLKPGDIAIVQVNFSRNSFDFVPLVDIAAGTKICFTDYAWKSSISNFDKSTLYDAIITYTAPSNIAKGTVIQSYNNTAFDNSSISYYSKNASNSYLKGENLIAFQLNANETTFLMAFGWMRKDNFAVNPYNSLAKVCDIPPGLSKENFTVIQMDSIVWGQNATLQRDFRYNKYDGFIGTASRIRLWLTKTSNYDTFSGYYNNDAVPNFTVNAPDIVAPSLSYSYPSNNKTNCSAYRSGILNFNEQVIIKKPLVLTDNSTNNVIKTFNINDLKTINDSLILFDLYQIVEKAKTYKLIIPAGFITDIDNNSWPTTEQTIIFATSANRSIVDLNFGEIRTPNVEVVKYFTRDNIEWTTTERFVEDNQNFCKGYFSWEMFGIPMRWYSDRVYVQSNIHIPQMGDVESKIATNIWLAPTDRLVVYLNGISNTITDIHSNVHENYCSINQKIYTGPQTLKYFNVSGTNAAEISKISYENTNNAKIDSLVYTSLEGNVSRILIEIVDQQAPIVELGNPITICESDSVLLDAGLTLGALYNWNTGSTTQKIWAKTSGNYSVTVKNALGEATDNVQVTVKPIINLSLPDTINACVGDTITLTAGTDVSNSYLWSPGGQTTPSIKVTQSGLYHVLVNNGAGGCLSTDTTRVIFKGAKVRLFNNQGGSYGSGDVRAELYRKNAENKWVVYRDSAMLGFVEFDVLPADDYIMKMHFVNYSFVGENPWMDTYQDGKTEWKKVTPFKLTCSTDTMISFSIANKTTFEFNGTGIISGKVQITGGGAQGTPAMLAKANTNVGCDTRVVLYNSNGDIIATTCPDANGNYSFTNLPAGDYTVGVERTGFEVQRAFTATVTAGATISNANFTVNETSQTVVQGLLSGVKQTMLSDQLNVQVYPNPAIGTTRLAFEMKQQEPVTITVTDITGKIVSTEHVNAISGRNIFSLNVNKLSGLYFVKIITTLGTAATRIVVK